MAHPSTSRRKNLFGFGKGKSPRRSTKRTTFSSALLKQAHDQGFKGVGGVRSDELFNEWVEKKDKGGELDGGFVKRLREAYWRGEKDAEKAVADAGVYRGKRIVKVGVGEYQVPSVDPESRFESVAEAKRFIEANPRATNPEVFGYTRETYDWGMGKPKKGKIVRTKGGDDVHEAVYEILMDKVRHGHAPIEVWLMDKWDAKPDPKSAPSLVISDNQLHAFKDVYYAVEDAEDNDKWRRDVDRVVSSIASGARVKSSNPAASPAQYRLAQAVLSGTARETGMDQATAREIVERTPARLRSEYSRHNPALQLLRGTKLYPDRELTQHDRVRHVIGGTPVEIIQESTGTGTRGRKSTRYFVRADYGGEAYWGWVDPDQLGNYETGEEMKVDKQGRRKNPPERFEVIIGPRVRGRFETFEDAAKFGVWQQHHGVHAGFTVRDVMTGADVEFGRSGNRKGNPEEAAAEVYEEFHGRPSTSTVELEEQVHYHGNLAELGVLCGLKVRTLSGYDCTLEFSSAKGQAANPSIYDYEDAQRAGREYGAKTYRDTGMSPHRIASTTVANYFNVWWESDGGKESATPKDKPGNRRAFVKAFKASGKNPRSRTRTGPLTSAYQFGTGAVHGVLGEADRVLGDVVGNPKVEAEIKDIMRTALESHFAEHGEPQKQTDWVYRPGGGRSAVLLKGKGNFEQYPWVTYVGPQGYWQATVSGSGFGIRGTPKRILAGPNVTRLIKELGFDPAQGQKANPDHGPVILCSNEARNQLYLRGGDQSLDLAAIHMDDHTRDSMVIGTVWALSYATRKAFDQGQEIEYVHVLGPEKFHAHLPKRADLWEDAEPPKDAAFEGGYLPTLRYDTLNKQLSMDGGVYTVKKEGIVD